MTTFGPDTDIDPHQSTCAYEAGDLGPMHEWAEVATDAALKRLHFSSANDASRHPCNIESE